MPGQTFIMPGDDLAWGEYLAPAVQGTPSATFALPAEAQPGWLGAYDRLRAQGMAQPEGTEIRADYRPPWWWGQDEQGRRLPGWTGGMDKSNLLAPRQPVEPVPLGDIADPVSQVAALLAPAMGPALRSFGSGGARVPMPEFGGSRFLTSERGSLGRGGRGTSFPPPPPPPAETPTLPQASDVTTLAERQRMINTARSAGRVGQRPTKVTQAALERVKPDESILDFGAGVNAQQTTLLRNAGYTSVTPTDLPEAIQASKAGLQAVPSGQTFDTVLASNVLNVQPHQEALDATLSQLATYMRPGGRAIVNYPKEPRRMALTADALQQQLEAQFSQVTRVGGTRSEPVFEVVK